MQKKKSNIHSKKAIALFGVIVILFGGFIFVDVRLRPVILTTAKYKIQGLIMVAVNTAIINQIDKTSVNYDDLVNVHKNDAGEILSISYDSVHVNKLKSEITKKVLEETQKIPDTVIYVPIGNITQIDLLQNKGPKLKFIITPSSFVESDIESSFQNTGINQTNHQIFIIIRVTGSALMPNYSTSVTVESKICVAETIIIGKVPNNIGNGVVYSQ